MLNEFLKLRNGLLAAALLCLLTACGGDDDGASLPEFSPEALHGGDEKAWKYRSSYVAEIDAETGDTLYRERDAVRNPCF